jgi:heme-degrading monooxygenase HmoA
MPVSLTIIRYKKWLVPFALVAMVLHRLPLFLNKKIRFYKLLGCGSNGTFSKRPDWQQWGILTVHKNELAATALKKLYGGFIGGWYQFFGCKTITYVLQPIAGHGLWDGKEIFTKLNEPTEHTGPIAVLTRATIHFSKLKNFWQHVNGVAEKMRTAKGFVTSYGIGELPWIKQATFSIWENKEDMKAFAYTQAEHKEVIKKTRAEKWYSEDMFVRFKIISVTGSLR